MFDYPGALLVIAPLVILAGYVVYGLGGFGSAIVAGPVLAHFLPLTFVVPLMVLLDFMASLFVGHKSLRHVSRPEMKRLLPFMFIGIALGVTLLVNLPRKPALMALGVFCVAFGAYSIGNPGVRGKIATWWSVPSGVAGGVLGALFGTGGPIYVVYLSHRLADKSELRATVSGLITVSTITRIVMYAITGLLMDLKLIVAAAVMIPVMWIGILIGTRLHLGLSADQLRRIVGVLLLINGASLIVKNLFQPA